MPTFRREAPRSPASPTAGGVDPGAARGWAAEARRLRRSRWKLLDRGRRCSGLAAGSSNGLLGSGRCDAMR